MTCGPLTAITPSAPAGRSAPVSGSTVLIGGAGHRQADRPQAVAVDLAAVRQLDLARHVHRDDRRELGAAVTLHRLDAQRRLDVAGQLGLELLGPQDQWVIV